MALIKNSSHNNQPKFGVHTTGGYGGKCDKREVRGICDFIVWEKIGQQRKKNEDDSMIG